MRRYIGLFVPGFLMLTPLSALAVSCDSASIQTLLVNATVTSAAETTVGATPYCDVHASITTDAALEDVINFEVGLPDAPYWKSRLLFTGNGGFGGILSLDTSDIQKGYATAATDTGHQSTNSFDASWTLNNSPAVQDFAYRSIHETAVAAEQILSGYYGTGYHSYFRGCSDAGRQGLVEAQLYPNDFNGIVAGDPSIGDPYLAYNWNEQAILADSSSFIDLNALNLVNQAVLTQCDGLDGVVDGLIQNPTACHFSPSTLLCATGQSPPGCLASGQVAAFNAIYQGPVDTTNASLYPGWSVSDPAPSSNKDAGWNVSLDGCTFNGTCMQPDLTSAEPFTAFSHTPVQWTAQDAYLKYFVFENASYDTRTFSFASQPSINSVTTVTKRWGGDGLNANLQPLANAQHKLLMYHGWSDPTFSPYVSVNYYNNVKAVLGSRTTNNVRLFMVPGMHHCQSSGPGPNTFDELTPIINWVEKGSAPNGFVASHRVNDDPTQPVDRTMPLCAYPQLAQYNGIGAVNTASSWSCPSN